MPDLDSSVKSALNIRLGLCCDCCISLCGLCSECICDVLNLLPASHEFHMWSKQQIATITQLEWWLYVGRWPLWGRFMMQGESSWRCRYRVFYQTPLAASGGKGLMKDDESIRTGCNTQVERCTQPQHNQTKSKGWAEGMQKQAAASDRFCCVSPQQKPLKTEFCAMKIMKWNGMLENILTQRPQIYAFLHGHKE